MQNRPNNRLTYFDINQSLTKYDETKRKQHKLFVADGGDVKSLRQFARDDNNELSCLDLFEVIKIIDALLENSKYGSSEMELINILQRNKEIGDLVSATAILKRKILTKDNFEAVLTVKFQHCDRFLLAAWALNKLDESGILVLENRDAINQCLGNPIWLARILVSLNESGILTSENRQILVNHSDLKNVCSALKLMYPPCLSFNYPVLFITQENFDAIVNHERPRELALELKTLARKGILNDQIREAVKKQPQPGELVRALICLHDPCGHYLMLTEHYTEELFTPENIDAVAKHTNPLGVVKALISLSEYKILTSENCDIVTNHPRPDWLATALISLDYKYKNSSFLAENINMIKAHPNPQEFYIALSILHQANLLTPENLEVAKIHPCAELFAKALTGIYEKRCLTQVFFHRIIKAANPAEEAQALVLDLPRLKNETCHPYTKGAIQGLFSRVYPNFSLDITNEIAEYIPRSSGANIAKTCKAAVAAAREQEKAHHTKYGF